MDEKQMEQIYKERLEERIIGYIASERSISLEKAMEIYYNSSLADKIHHGEEGIQYLDYKVLAKLLDESEI